MSHTLTLVSHDLCPYVQRAAISLREKDVGFERIDIDLANKPDWFKAISPLGKVPLLRVRHDDEETVIFESAVILEFLEETEANPLHPADPRARARHRAWIEFGSAILNAIARFYSANTESSFESETKALSGMFVRVEAALTGNGLGPWFDGELFSLVDAVYGPVFRYFDTFDRIGDFGVLSGKPRVAAWRRALAERPSVVGAVAADYPEKLRAHLAEKTSHLAKLIKLRDVQVAA